MAQPDRFDPYRVLGVTRDATASQVGRAYRTMAKRLHPDLHGPDVDGRMQELNRAFRILSDPGRRNAWDERHPAAPTPPHWGATPRAPSPPSREAGPSSWAAWQEDRAAADPAPVRVRVREPWPRPPAAAPVSPTGLRDSAWLAMGVALVLVVAVIVLGWIASSGTVALSARQAMGFLGVTPTAMVALDTQHELAIYRAADGMLGLAAARRVGDGWEARILAERRTAHPFSVLLVTRPGEVTGPWRAVVFGRAQPGVERVRLIGVQGRGGDVANGTWAMGVREALTKESLRWEFTLPDGRVVLEGGGQLGG